MSFGLEVFAFDRPDLCGALSAVLPATVRVDGDATADAASVELSRSTRRGERHVCVVDGPLVADDEDLPETVAPVLLGCHWLVQLTMPWSIRRDDLRLVERLAKALAKSGRGVVYDPQGDEVVWPKRPRMLRRVGSSDDANDVGRVELQWLFARRLTSGDAHHLLGMLRRTIPEATPVRFGTYEPLQQRLDRDGEDAFASGWDGDEMLFWTGRRPSGGGHVSLARWFGLPEQDPRAAAAVGLGGRAAPEIDLIGLEFRTEVVDDARWVEALERLFRRVSEQFAPFFAAAYCAPDRNGDAVNLLPRFWLGIPPADLWLVYAGHEYLPLLASSSPTPVGRGGLITLADHPTDWQSIERHAATWPAELMRREIGGSPLAAKLIPALDTVDQTR